MRGKSAKNLVFESILFLLILTFLVISTSASDLESIRADKTKPVSLTSGFEFKFQPAPANIAGFLDCSFTRPFGYKLEQFGHTSAPGNIDNNSEGSACPVVRKKFTIYEINSSS